VAPHLRSTTPQMRYVSRPSGRAVLRSRRSCQRLQPCFHATTYLWPRGRRWRSRMSSPPTRGPGMRPFRVVRSWGSEGGPEG